MYTDKKIFSLKMRYYIFGVLLLIVITCLFFTNRKEKKSIIIGFSAQLTGRQAELGVQERNGVQLAIEKINASGGINGRKISLIIHDDLGIPEEAEAGDDELIISGAIAIIGHATSAQTVAGLKAANAQNVVMIGPTVSSPKLSYIDDCFFRVYPSFKDSSEAFAKYAYESDAITRMAIIYDEDNLVYSKTYSTVFSDKFFSLGGKITDEVGFSSKGNPDFSLILSNLEKLKPQGLLIVASDTDTAFIAQRVRIMGWKVSMFASDWAQTETLIDNGGQAVEGMKIEQSYALDSKSQAFIDFKSNYKERFGSEPSFGAAFSYEAVLVLEDALKKTNGSKYGLKQALLRINSFSGLTDTFSFDGFGDVKRPWYLSTIFKGKFVIVDKINGVNSEENKR